MEPMNPWKDIKMPGIPVTRATEEEELQGVRETRQWLVKQTMADLI